MIGSYIPSGLSERLGLLAVYRNASRSVIIRKAIQHELDQAPTEPNLINAIAYAFFEDWESSAMSGNQREFNKFIASIDQSLTNKRITQQHRSLIIKRLQERYDETRKEKEWKPE
jgi:predicted transcriptional regulator